MDVSDLPSVVVPSKSSFLSSLVAVLGVSSLFSEEPSVFSSSVVFSVSPSTFVSVPSPADSPFSTVLLCAACASKLTGFPCAETYRVPIGVLPAANAIDKDTAKALLMFFLIIFLPN